MISIVLDKVISDGKNYFTNGIAIAFLLSTLIVLGIKNTLISAFISIVLVVITYFLIEYISDGKKENKDIKTQGNKSSETVVNKEERTVSKEDIAKGEFKGQTAEKA